MAQAGSNYEKNGGSKSRWTVPLMVVFVGGRDCGEEQHGELPDRAVHGSPLRTNKTGLYPYMCTINVPIFIQYRTHRQSLNNRTGKEQKRYLYLYMCTINVPIFIQYSTHRQSLNNRTGKEQKRYLYLYMCTINVPIFIVLYNTIHTQS